MARLFDPHATCPLSYLIQVEQLVPQLLPDHGAAVLGADDETAELADAGHAR